MKTDRTFSLIKWCMTALAINGALLTISFLFRHGWFAGLLMFVPFLMAAFMAVSLWREEHDHQK